MQDYRKMAVWEQAHQLVLEVYGISSGFPKEELFSLTMQLRRAVMSVAANIAEGCGRNTRSDFANFLNISLGSANETSYFLLLAKDLNYLSEEKYLIL